MLIDNKKISLKDKVNMNIELKKTKLHTNLVKKQYNYKTLNIETYIESLYEDGIRKSTKLNDDELKSTILNIGIFKLKGYVKAFRSGLNRYTFDDLIALYETDRKISSNLFMMTSKIEIKLKSYLVEIVYELTDNPFFYLLKENYKEDFNLSNDSLRDWEVREHNQRQKESEIYMHYRDYYLSLYDYKSNKDQYIKDKELIGLDDHKNINYPPFHYFIESSPLGTLINIISKLNINDNDILKRLGNKFNIYTPKVFLSYLLRLKEVRNRCAHNDRLINRNYRGLKAFKNHKKFRKIIYEHKLIDVYFTLYLLLDDIKRFKTVDDLVESFTSDNLSTCEEHIKQFVLSFLKQGECACIDSP